MLDGIGQVCWFGILATPLIAFLIVRKSKAGIGTKIIEGVAITIVLAGVLFLIAMGILTRNGIGPG